MAAAGPSRDLVGGALVGLTSAQFAGVVVLGKIATQEGGSVAGVLTVRFAFGALLLAVLVLALGRSLRPAPGEGWKLAALGVVGYAGESGLYLAALGHGTVAAVSLLFFTYPAWVAVITLLTGRGRPGRLVAVALGVTMTGTAVVILSAGGVEIRAAGIGLALASSVVVALYLLGADAVLDRTDSLVGAMAVSAGAAAGLGTFGVATRSVELPGSEAWLAPLAMGALSAGAFVSLFAGLRRLGAVRTAIVSSSEPLASALLAAMVLHEAVGPGTAVGGLLILAGAVTASLARPPPVAEAPTP